MKKIGSLLLAVLWLFPMALGLAEDGNAARHTFQGIPWETTQEEIIEVFEKNTGILLEDGGGSVFSIPAETTVEFFGGNALLYVIAEETLSSINFGFEEWYPMPENGEDYQVSALTHFKEIFNTLLQENGEPTRACLRWEKAEDEMLWDIFSVPLPFGDDAIYTFQQALWEEGLVELIIYFENVQLYCQLSLEDEALSAIYGLDYYADEEEMLCSEEDWKNAAPVALKTSPVTF